MYVISLMANFMLCGDGLLCKHARILEIIYCYSSETRFVVFKDFVNG